MSEDKTIVEVNLHTGDKREVCYGELKLVLRALRLPRDEISACLKTVGRGGCYETKHCWYRPWRPDLDV